MTYWPRELDQDNEMYDAWTAYARQPQGLQFTPKVAPSFDGRTSRLLRRSNSRLVRRYTLTPDRWAPSLKAILVGEANIYKLLLKRERMRDPNEGVDYFKTELRPHFVNGVETVLVLRY